MFKPRQSSNIFKTKITRKPVVPDTIRPNGDTVRDIEDTIRPARDTIRPAREVHKPARVPDDEQYLPGERLMKKLSKSRRRHPVSISYERDVVYSEDDLLRCQNAIDHILQSLKL